MLRSPHVPPKEGRRPREDNDVPLEASGRPAATVLTLGVELRRHARPAAAPPRPAAAFDQRHADPRRRDRSSGDLLRARTMQWANESPVRGRPSYDTLLHADASDSSTRSRGSRRAGRYNADRTVLTMKLEERREVHATARPSPPMSAAQNLLRFKATAPSADKNHLASPQGRRSRESTRRPWSSR